MVLVHNTTATVVILPVPYTVLVAMPPNTGVTVQRGCTNSVAYTAGTAITVTGGSGTNSTYKAIIAPVTAVIFTATTKLAHVVLKLCYGTARISNSSILTVNTVETNVNTAPVTVVYIGFTLNLKEILPALVLFKDN